MKKKHIFHVISNTHWDREWRFTFQRNRQLLVEMIDKLIEILEAYPEYRAFHLDSQTIVLEDYLEIRPQNRHKLEKLIKEKRILVGPLFILPEEFQVGGESLIRNLLLGHRMAREFGHVMKVGYSPFSWGQISQLPQIYAGFGIDVIMFYRGINSLDSPKAEFIWEGADGTRALTSRFSTMPRYNFYFYIYRPVVHNEQIPDVEYTWSRGGIPFHFADTDLKDEDYNLLRPLNEYHSENLEPAIKAIIDRQLNDFTTSHIFWAEGHDSSGPNAKTVHLIKDADTLLPDDQVKHSTLEDYAAALKESIKYDELKVVSGERRSSQYDINSGNLYGYTTSARMYLKQENYDAERWLQYYAEPFNTIAGILGMDTNDRYLDRAWHYLLQNAAHDSIGGCSLDPIHEDMMFRYRQVKDISKGVFNRACRFLAGQIDLKKYEKNSIHLVAVNPLPFDRDDIVEAFIDVPEEFSADYIRVVDENGRSLSMQLIGQENTEPVLEQMIDRPMFFRMKRYQALMELKAIPSMGFRTFHVERTPESPSESDSIVHVRNGTFELENEYLNVKIKKNGTLTVTYLETGKTFDNLAWFRDEGEAGHAWVHEPAGPVFDSLSSEPEVTLLQNGPLYGEIRINYKLKIPVDLEARKNGGPCPDLPVQIDLSLKKGSGRVDLTIDLDNRAESHRLRVMFPTGIDAQYSYGEGQFDVVSRPIARKDTSDWIEQPMYDYPMHHFVDVSDGQSGAAVLVDGLKEYEVLDDADRTLAITLLRGFRYVIQPSSVQDFSEQKGSQCLGRQRYRLAFYPHRGRWDEGRVFQEALRFNYPLRLFQIGRSEGDLPEKWCFITMEPDVLVLSSLKAAESGSGDTIILRIYNPTAEVISGSLLFGINILSADEVTLEEKVIRALQIDSTRRLRLKIPVKKIKTLRLITEAFNC